MEDVLVENIIEEKYFYLLLYVSIDLIFLKTIMNENPSNSECGAVKNEKANLKGYSMKQCMSEVSKEMKSKYGVSYADKSIKIIKQHPMSKRKSLPISNHMESASTKVVLFERNVEIKDLESKVKFLQTKLKEFESENRTLRGVQTRQEKELKKFKEGVADIPSLLRAHREENKVYETAISNIRKELRDCQKELKNKNDINHKKESQIDKLNVIIKNSEKKLQDAYSKIKELETVKSFLGDENEMLVNANQKLKCENEGLYKKIEELSREIESLKIINKRSYLNQYESRLENSEYQKPEDFKHKDLFSQRENCGENANNEIGLCDNLKIDSEKLHHEKLEKDDHKGKASQSDRNKEALIHTLKCYQDLNDAKLNRCNSMEFRGIKANLKLLPPLKQPSKKYIKGIDSCDDSKELSSSGSISIRESKTFSKWDTISQDFENKLKTDACEFKKLEIKRSELREPFKRERWNDFREVLQQSSSDSECHVSLLDDW